MIASSIVTNKINTLLSVFGIKNTAESKFDKSVAVNRRGNLATPPNVAGELGLAK